jgi:hypothetical protein
MDGIVSSSPTVEARYLNAVSTAVWWRSAAMARNWLMSSRSGSLRTGIGSPGLCARIRRRRCACHAARIPADAMPVIASPCNHGIWKSVCTSSSTSTLAISDTGVRTVEVGMLSGAGSRRPAQLRSSNPKVRPLRWLVVVCPHGLTDAIGSVKQSSRTNHTRDSPEAWQVEIDRIPGAAAHRLAPEELCEGKVMWDRQRR